MPMAMLARRLARSETGSISAPARNVSTPLPSMARKLVQSVDCRMCWPSPKWMLPAATPTTISISATEMPTRMEIKLAMNASPIQIAAINQIFSVIKFSCSSSILFDYDYEDDEEDDFYCAGKSGSAR